MKVDAPKGFLGHDVVRRVGRARQNVDPNDVPAFVPTDTQTDVGCRYAMIVP